MSIDSADTIWAIEIETAVVATLWRQPVRCAEFLRQCDPLVHLTQPHLRVIVDAVALAYGELGDTDWATVIEVIRELGQLEQVGGLHGLNDVYTAVEITPVTEPIFMHHLEMLKLYAAARTQDPPRLVTRFSGAKASLYPNKNKRSPNDCDWTGQVRMAGRKYAVRAWMALDGSFLNLIFAPFS